MSVEAFTPEPPPDGGQGAASSIGLIPGAELGSPHAMPSVLGGTAARRRSRGLAPSAALMILDFVTVLALFGVTAVLPGLHLMDDRFGASESGPFGATALLVAALAPLAIGALGGYRPADARMGGQLLRHGRLSLSAGLCLWAAWLIGGLLDWSMSLEQFFLIWLTAPVAWLVARGWVRVGARGVERTLVIGSGRVAGHIAELSRRHPEQQLEIVGCLDDHPALDLDGAPPTIGLIEDLERVISERSIDRVIVCFSQRGDEHIMGILRACTARGVPVDVVPRLFDIMGPEPRTRSLGSLPLLAATEPPPALGQRAAKRGFDIVLSGVAFLLAAPIMAIVAVVAMIDDGRPVLYRQERIGRDGRPFSILKFRTMVRDADRIGMERIATLSHENGLDIEAAVEALKQERDPRITRIGHFLRKTSLDELPQLLNVLRGDMSLVGPRPLRPFEVEALSDWQHARQGVRPGITGLWQVLGRSEVRWSERMQMDYRYARHWSLSYDLRIIVRTVAVVVAKRGAL